MLNVGMAGGGGAQVCSKWCHVVNLVVSPWNGIRYSEFLGLLNEKGVLICDARYSKILLNECLLSKGCLYIINDIEKKITEFNVHVYVCICD